MCIDPTNGWTDGRLDVWLYNLGLIDRGGISLIASIGAPVNDKVCEHRGRPLSRVRAAAELCVCLDVRQICDNWNTSVIVTTELVDRLRRRPTSRPGDRLTDQQTDQKTDQKADQKIDQRTDQLADQKTDQHTDQKTYQNIDQQTYRKTDQPADQNTD